jgi:hypothetical protein
VSGLLADVADVPHAWLTPYGAVPKGRRWITERIVGKIDFPLVADVNHSIMTAYGIVHPAGIALRASFLIDES